MLKQNHSGDLRVFVVWEPMLLTDWFRPNRLVQRRISDSRAAQFWDKNHLVAKEVRAHLSEWRGDCCSQNGILWDVVGVYPKKAKWDSAPVFLNGPVVRATPEAAKQLELLSGMVR
jgi:hypothetical protein